MSVFFALLTLIGWGVGDVFGTFAIRRIGSIPANFWWSFLGLIFASLYIPFAGPIADYKYFLIAVLISAFNVFGILFFYKGLQYGNASLNGTICGSYVLVTFLLSVVLFGETLSPGLTLGIFLIFIGIIAGSINFKDRQNLKLSDILSDKGIKYSFLAMFEWGFYFSLVRIPAQEIGFFWAGLPIYILGTIFMFLLSKKKISSLKMDKKTLTFMLLFTILTVSANFSYNLGILAGFTSVVAPISSGYPVLYVLLTGIFLKEKLFWQQKIGILFSLTGILVIGSSY